VSALAGTDLEMVLRANAIETLVLARIATSGGRPGYFADCEELPERGRPGNPLADPGSSQHGRE
jgi:hypothetical protein